MSNDILELAKRGHGELPEPRALPGGHWVLAADRIYFTDARPETADKKASSASVKFSYRAKEPMADVDPAALAELPSGYSYGITSVRSEVFWLGEYTDLARIWTHLKKHDGFALQEDVGLLVEGENGSLQINPVVRAEFTGKVIVAELSRDSYGEGNANTAKKFVPFREFVAAA